MMMSPQRKGGVEEKKEDNMEHEVLSPDNRTAPQSTETFDEDDEQVHGIQAQLQRFAKTVFGSCGGVLEAATHFVQNQCVRNPPDPQQAPIQPMDYRPALSIAEELRLLAEKEGRPFPQPPRRGDIPKFLGEDAVYSFEDDNISAISQNTLEEMARNGQRAARQQAYYRKMNNEIITNPPPSPVRTQSLSSNSSKERKEEGDDRENLEEDRELS